jgi:glucose-6-phosphate 1-epimerase
MNEEINALNRDFGVPGRIAFRAGPLGEPVVVLVEAHGSCEVTLHGAHVLSYRPTGHAPVLWLAKSFKTLEPGAAIRGGVPVCWPWFGPREGLPAHGFARISRWRLLKTDYDSYSTAATFVLEDTGETRAMWPHRFRLEYEVSVGATLRLSLSATNTGDAPFDVREALHSYFVIGDVATVRVSGLDGVKYLDRAPGGVDAVQSGDVSIAAETDRIYIDAPDEEFIEDPAAGRRIRVAKDGAADCVVWNPWIAKAARLSDMEDDDYRRFLCVETAQTKPVTIAPGQTHRIRASISAEHTQAEQIVDSR